MELNAKQIIKALECCIECECGGCTYDEQTACKEYLLNDALALIKELTEVVEQSETARGRKESIDNGFSPSVTELQRENERVRTAIPLWAKQCVELEERCMQLRAGTVRKMQERLMAKAYYPKPYGMARVVDECDIDQIVKEMLEGGK